MPDKFNDTCVLCLVIGTYLTWGLLLFGGIVGILSTSGIITVPEIINRWSAYLTAFSLFLFVVSYFLARIAATERAT